MSEPEQCIICLEPLPRLAALNPSPQDEAPPSTAAVHDFLARDGSEDDTVRLDIVAALDGCEHINHDACIRSWAQKTNTCPICRMPFHTVRVYNGADGECGPFISPTSGPGRQLVLTSNKALPSPRTRSKTVSRWPTSMPSSGWPRIRIPRMMKPVTLALYATPPIMRTCCFSVTAAKQPTIPIVSEWTMSLTETGSAWSASMSLIRRTRQARHGLRSHRLHGDQTPEKFGDTM